MIFDTHAHYDDDAFDEDRQNVLETLSANNVGRVVNVGAHLLGSQRSVDLARRYDFIYAAVGIHPDDANQVDDTGIAKLKDLCQNEKVVAIGEIGLDYYWNKDNKEIQKKAFERQILLAKDLSLPIIIHSRDAAEDTLNILKTLEAGVNGGVMHCFSYSPEIASEVIKLGFNIGVGGVLTFKNGKKLRETVEAVPIEKIVLETDCPYLSPEPFRGKRNTSPNIAYVVEEICRIKNLDRETVEKITFENACRMYGMKL